MAKKPMKRFSKSLIIRNGNETTMRYHLMPMRMATTGKEGRAGREGRGGKGERERGMRVSQDREKLGIVLLVQLLGKTVQPFPNKLKPELPHDPAISLSGI